MNPKELIEAYVTEVAARLPRAQRNDVAFELRALLMEELEAKADAAGRPADAAFATELLQAFGRPAEVAARYRPTLTIIDPADGRRFLRATWVGLVLIWTLGLWARLPQPLPSGWDWLTPLGAWWTGTVLPSFWWPGVLVVWFGLASWSQRRAARSAESGSVSAKAQGIGEARGAEWKMLSPDRIQGGRPAQAMGLVGILGGLYLLLDPRFVLDLFWGGGAAPSAYAALTYTDSFRARQGPLLLGLLALYVLLFLVVLVRGRRSKGVRRLEYGLGLAICAAMIWTALDGPVFHAPASDGLFKLIVGILALLTLAFYVVQHLRSVRPAPAGGIPTAK